MSEHLHGAWKSLLCNPAAEANHLVGTMLVWGAVAFWLWVGIELVVRTAEGRPFLDGESREEERHSGDW